MEYIVCRLPDAQGDFARAVAPDIWNITRTKDRPSSVYTSEREAKAVAQRLSTENPGHMYAVFVPMVVYDTQAPEPPKVVVKVYNDRKELVVIED